MSRGLGDVYKRQPESSINIPPTKEMPGMTMEGFSMPRMYVQEHKLWLEKNYEGNRRAWLNPFMGVTGATILGVRQQ